METKQKQCDSISETLDTRILESVKRIKPPPVAVMRLMDILATEFHTNEVMEVLNSDPSLTATVLKKCNTAFFSQRGGVTSLNQAIQLLGTSMIMSMVMELTVGVTLDKELKSYGYSAKNLRNHSLLTALISKELTQYCGILPFTADTAFTAGLLHDIGKLVVDDMLSGMDIQHAINDDLSEVLNVEMERHYLDTDHASIGAAILEYWKFPVFFCEAVLQHHAPMIGNQLAHLILVSNWCAHTFGEKSEDPGTADSIPIESLSSVGLTHAVIEETSHEVLQNFKKYSH